MRSSDRFRSRIDKMRQNRFHGANFPDFGGLRRPNMIKVFFGFLAGNMLLCMFIFGLSALVGAFAWPYAINEWLVLVGKPASVEPMHGALIGLVPGFGWASLPAAVITWIAMLFLG